MSTVSTVSTVSTYLQYVQYLKCVTQYSHTVYSIYAPVEAVVPVYEGLNVSISPATVAAPHTTSSSVVDWLEPAADSDEKVE